jgi:hypothetical protein
MTVEDTHMADPRQFRDSGSNPGEADGAGPDHEPPAGTPRWVKMFAIIALVIIVLFLILMVTRGPGGRHGPGRHIGPRDAAGLTPLSSTRHAPLPGGH